MFWKELCRWCRRKNIDHDEEAISHYRPKTRPPDGGRLPTTSKPKPAGEGDASQSMEMGEASGSHEKSSTAEASDSHEKSSTQSKPPNTGDPFDHREPKGQVDKINQPTQPNNARDAARTPHGEFSAKDQTKGRNNYSADDDGAEKVEEVPKKENNSS